MFRIILLSILSIVSLATAVSADAPGAFAELQRNVHFVTLENGIRVIMYRRGKAPVFSGTVVVRVGGVDEPAGLSGISHMFEHMAFKGTPEIGSTDYAKEKKLLAELEVLRAKEADGAELSAEEISRIVELENSLKKVWRRGEISEEIERRGGVGLNAQTSNDLTTYYVDLPSSQLEFYCHLESERILEPVLREFYQERDVVMEERRMRIDGDPEGKLYEALLGTAYQVHPYHKPVIGYARDIQKLTATKVENFRKKYYVPSNIVVSLVGDVDPVRDLELVRKYFGRIPTGPLPQKPQIDEPRQQEEKRVVVKGEFSPQVAIAYHKVQYPDPDGAALSAMLSVLGESKTSWLYDRLVKNERLVSDTSVFSGPGYLYPDLAIFWMTPLQPHSNADALKGFDKVIEDFKKTGPTREQLEVVKRRLQVGLLSHISSNNALARDFAENEAIFGNWKATFDEYQQILKLSREDIMRVSNKYLVQSTRTVGSIERVQK